MTEGHIRPRGKGAWELKYDVGIDPLTGRRVTKYATVRGPKRDAQRELRRRLDAVDQGRHADPGKLSAGGWLREWLDLAQNEFSPTTWERFADIVNKHLIPALGALPLAKLQPVHIQSYYAKALKSGRRDGKGGLSPQTICHHHGVLSLALKRARSLRLIATNPVEDVKRPKVERQEIEYLDPSDAVKLLRTAAGTRLHAPIFLALATGVRRGELLALRWSDLDLDRGSLTVAQAIEQTKAGGLRFKPPKTKRSRRVIALSPSVVDLLRAHKVQQARERLALGLGKDDLGLVFTRLDGSIINPRNFTKKFSRLVAQAEVRLISLHGLRHTHITDLLRAGVHPKIASERAGHASVAITMDIYSHAVPGLQEDAALRIDSALRGLLEY